MATPVKCLRYVTCVAVKLRTDSPTKVKREVFLCIIKMSTLDSLLVVLEY